MLNIAASELGSHPRASVQVADATEINAPDKYFDLAVMAFTFHHLSPAQAVQVIAEGTRVADKLLIIDMPRPRSLLHIAKLASFVPFLVIPFAHDGFISSTEAATSKDIANVFTEADVDKNGKLDRMEYAQAVKLVQG